MVSLTSIFFPIPRLTSSQDIASASIQRAHHELDLLEKEFRHQTESFVLPHLIFDSEVDGQTANSSSLETPTLPYSSNKAFLSHQNLISKLVDKLDRLDSAGDQGIKDRRRALVLEVQAHEDFLDTNIRDAWMKKRMMDGPKDPNVPEFVDVCELISFPITSIV